MARDRQGWGKSTAGLGRSFDFTSIKSVVDNKDRAISSFFECGSTQAILLNSNLMVDKVRVGPNVNCAVAQNVFAAPPTFHPRYFSLSPGVIPPQTPN